MCSLSFIKIKLNDCAVFCFIIATYMTMTSPSENSSLKTSENLGGKRNEMHKEETENQTLKVPEHENYRYKEDKVSKHIRK